MYNVFTLEGARGLTFFRTFEHRKIRKLDSTNFFENLFSYLTNIPISILL